MYQYLNVGVEAEGILDIKLDAYRDVLDKYAAEGWRYVGYVPVRTTPRGGLIKIDLIFEQEAKEET